MESSAKQTFPRARTRELIVRELPEEVLVYDLERQKAHCLNNTSAFVWRRCDGKTTAAEMARLLEREFSTPVGEDVVRLALGQLRRFHLLEEGGGRRVGTTVSRRDLVRKYLPAALVLPAIITISSPSVAQASSHCRGVEEPCDIDHPCCAGLACGEFGCFDPS